VRASFSIDDLTAIQRRYLKHLNRVRLGLRPSNAQVPNDKSISALLDLKLIAPHPSMANKALTPFSMAVWVLTDRGADLIEHDRSSDRKVRP
jgi:hypothetical protein